MTPENRILVLAILSAMGCIAVVATDNLVLKGIFLAAAVFQVTRLALAVFRPRP